jgi:hypothetical protein
MLGSAASAKQKGIYSLVILVCWTVWEEQNARIFDAKEKQHARIVTEIKDEARLWIQADAKRIYLC